MTWKECSKEQYVNAYNYTDAVCSAEKQETIWRHRNGNPVAKTSKGYIPSREQERFWIWRDNAGQM